MTRKLLPLALVPALFAATCSEPPSPEVEFGSGQRFVPFVADPLNDAGVDASVSVNPEGLPVVAYFGFEEAVEEGEIPQTRPVTAPSLPGVLLTTASSDGIWTRGAAALPEAIPSVNVAFNPGFEESVADLSARNVTGLQVVADGATLHVIWGSVRGLFYATGSSDPASTTPFEISKVTSTPPVGPSIAVVDGTPWIAFLTSTSASASVELATPDGDRWQIDTVAGAAGCDACRTAVVATTDGPAVAFASGGTVEVAINDGENGWVNVDVEGGGGQGLSGVATEQGIALAYYSDGEVHLATGPASGPFDVSTVAAVSDGSAETDGAETSVAVDDSGAAWVAWVDAADGVGFASGDGAELTPIETGADTERGSMPSVAVTPDGSNAYLAWYDTVNQDLLVGAYAELEGLAIAVPSPEPSGPPPPQQPPDGECAQPADGVVAITALGLTFDVTCVDAPPDEAVTIEFDNQDAAQHNVAIYPSADEVTNPILQEPPFTGPGQATYDVPALEVGEYYFQCDVHPTTMNGAWNVVGGGGGGGGGGDGGGGEGTTGGTGSTGTTGATGSTGTTGATGSTG